MLQIKNTLGGGKPEGLYAWKKNSVSKVDNPITKSGTNYTLGTATSDTIVYYSTSYTFDESTGIYTLVNPQSATLAYNGSGGVASVQMVKSTYYIWGSTSSNEIYNTNSSSTYNVYLKNASGSIYLESTAANEKYDIHSAKTEYTFLGYIVSDKETAYPDGGEKGGYWYEKVAEGLTPEMLGFTKYEVGSFTLSSNNSTITFNHTLGEKPKAVIVNEDSRITDLKYVNTYLTTGVYSAYSYNKRAAEYGTYNNTSNETTVEITTGNTTRNFKAGVKYNYVVFA